MNSLKNKKMVKGQGALEYLLLIGGAVLVATIVLITILGTAGSTNTIISNNLGEYQTHINLGASAGGGVNLCGTAGQVCASGSSQACVSGNYPGNQSCNSNCSGYNSCVTTESCGDGIINGITPEACDTLGNIGCTGGQTCNASCSACNAGPDTSAPTFSFSVPTVPNSYGGTVRVDLGWTATDATIPIQYASTTPLLPGLAREDGGQTTLNTMTTVANFSGQAGITYQSPANNAVTYSDTDNTLDDIGLLVGQQSCYNMMFCDSVSPTPYCDVNPVGSIVCAIPWQSVIFEAESYVSAGTNVLSGPHTDTAAVTETVIYDDPTTCSGGGNNQANYTGMINFSDHLASTSYRAWVRMATNDTTTTAMNVITRIGSAAFGNPIAAGTTPGTAYTWVQSTLDSTVVADGAQGFTVIVPCGHTGTGESTWIDKVLFTTNVSCTPVGNGSNCT